MATIFPREEKAEALFGEILKNPEACHRLMDTFNDSLDMADVLDAPAVSAQQFAAALFNAYENKEMCIRDSMMTPFLYLAIKSLYWSKGGTLKKILWCDDDSICLLYTSAEKRLFIRLKVSFT